VQAFVRSSVACVVAETPSEQGINMKLFHVSHFNSVLLLFLFLFAGCNDEQHESSSSSQWGEQLDIPIATTETGQEGTSPGHTVNGSTEQNTTANENNANTTAANPAPTLVLKSLILKTQKIMP